MKNVLSFTDVKVYFSENSSNMHIMTVLMHFCSINQMLKYKWRITALHRKKLLKALKICALSDSVCHKLISSYNNHCISVTCLLNNRKISLVKTQFIFHCLTQQQTERLHDSRTKMAASEFGSEDRVISVTVEWRHRSNNRRSVLIIVHDYSFLSQYPQYNAQGATEATQILT
jgi:hypothetical protein